jgi:tetratricopeptide (TPR) repeat protein
MRYRKAVQSQLDKNKGNLSIFAINLLERKRADWKLSIESAENIRTEVINIYEEQQNRREREQAEFNAIYKEKVKEYEESITHAVNNSDIFELEIEEAIEEYQKYLGISDSDIKSVHEKISRMISDRNSDRAHIIQIKMREKESSTDRVEAEIIRHEIAIKLYPNNTKAYEKLGKLLESKGRNYAIAAMCYSAIESSPTNWKYFSKIHQMLGKALMADWIQESDRLHKKGGTYYRQVEKKDKIVNSYRNAVNAENRLDLDGKAWMTKNEFGFILWELGLTEEAISQISPCLKSQACFYETYTLLANLLAQQDTEKMFLSLSSMYEYETACEFGAQIGMHYPKRAGSHFVVGLAFSFQGMMEEANLAYKTALHIDLNLDDLIQRHRILGISSSNNEVILCIGQGDLFKIQNKTEKAIAAYRTALLFSPNHAVAHRKLGDMLTQLGQLEEAMTECQTSLKLDPGDAYTHFCYANVLRAQGKLTEAITSYHIALQLNPNLAIVKTILDRAMKIYEAEEKERKRLTVQSQQKQVIVNQVKQKRPRRTILNVLGFWDCKIFCVRG